MPQDPDRESALGHHTPSPPPPRVRLRVKLSAILLLVLVSAALSEAALRVVLLRLNSGLLVYLHPSLKARYPGVQARIQEQLPYFNLRQEDPVTGWTFKPNLNCKSTNEDSQPYDLTTSPEGYFTPDQPAEDDRQIIVLGDSFASTFYVPRPIVYVMRDELRTPVYNLAVSGWGPESYRAAYQQRGQTRKHDTVVVFSFLNDITDVNNWNRWKAESGDESFSAWIQRASANSNLVNQGQSLFDRHSVAWNCLKAVWTSSRRRTPLASAMPIGNANTADQEQFTDAAGRSYSLQFTRGCAFTKFDPLMFQPGGTYFSYMDAYFASLERLRNEIAAAGARMALVWIPAKERVYLPLLPVERSAAWISNSTKQIDGIERVLHEFAGEAGITFLDLSDDLTSRARRGEKLYFTIDGHLNDHGNVVVGERVAAFLKTLPAEAPQPIPTEQRRLRPPPAVIDAPLAARDVSFRDPCAQRENDAWRLQGKPAASFDYLLCWPPQETGPTRLVVRGNCDAGGITVGAVRNDQWYVQQNVTTPGKFDVTLTIQEPGAYGIIVAGCLQGGADRLDVTVSEIGFASDRRASTANAKAPHPVR